MDMLNMLWIKSSGVVSGLAQSCQISCFPIGKNLHRGQGKDPPSSPIWTSDLRITATNHLQSSALPTELSKEAHRELHGMSHGNGCVCLGTCCPKTGSFVKIVVDHYVHWRTLDGQLWLFFSQTNQATKQAALKRKMQTSFYQIFLFWTDEDDRQGPLGGHARMKGVTIKSQDSWTQLRSDCSALQEAARGISSNGRALA